MENGTQFFDNHQDIYQSYLRRTDQKLKTAKVVARAISNLFDRSKPLRMLCVGGGTGDADLRVAALLPRYSFEIENIDPSMVMCDQFAKTASLLENVQLISNRRVCFEDVKTKTRAADLILCINSIYFLRGWRSPDQKNPILKLYSCLRPGGLAAIVLKSSSSDHFQVKKLADAGHTCGERGRCKKAPHFIENSLLLGNYFRKN